MSKPNQIQVFKDGNQFCATLPTFVDLQESTAGFGNTKVEAKLALVTALYNKLRPTGHGADTGNSGSCGDCEGRADWENEASQIYVGIEE